MRVITLSKRKFESLEQIKLSRNILNTESNIYMFNYKNEPKVIKKLFYQEGDVFANKLYTLEMLSSNKKNLPESFAIPDSLISVSGHIQGFSIPFIEGENLTNILNDKEVSLEEKKYFLVKVGEILNQLKAIRNYTDLKDIYLGDLHSSNFIANKDNKKLSVVDLDSCKIKGNKSSVSKYLNELSILNYVKGKYEISNNDIGYVKIDENTDLFCYNMMILEFLYGKGINDLSIDEYLEYLDYLKYIGLDYNLIESFYTLVTNKKNENISSLINTINTEQICRANQLVYKKVKKNFGREK
ncbi:MAG: hypothetical protein IJ568_04110 [Bacilli bacterium]|nr:hypothetical protein [Bacilli bacterium]